MTRCFHCQQVISHDGLVWFHTNRALSYCLPVPGYPITHASPEPQK